MNMKVHVFAEDGKKTEKQVELDKKVFAVEPNDHAIWFDVKVIRANGRQGTHATKGRIEVAGGGRKPFRQKGTGRARQGTIRAPHHVGGGRVFGPSPRDYSMKINKKLKNLARRSALSYKAKDKKVLVVENFDYEAPSTKKMKSFLESLTPDARNILICTADYSKNILKSATNLYNVQIRESATFSTYDVLKADTVVLQEGALSKVSEVLGK
jgi:large subunit ribosomal protein L4